MKRNDSPASKLRAASRSGAAASSPPPAPAGTPPDPRAPSPIESMRGPRATDGAVAASSFPRRVLLAVTGLSPQIVTETLYALAVQSAERFVPTEIHLITTRQGAEHARLNLLSQQIGWFHRLRADYKLPAIAFGADHIHVIPDETGGGLDDIRTLADNARAADFITERVRELTADPECALHVSIAGGRKTMGYYLGYALSLFGRPQDRLSHVLVSAPYENNRDFYYPTPYEHAIHVTQNGKEVAYDCRKAVVDLADIPFVRLRDGLPPRLHAGHASLSEVVAAANRALLPPKLVIDIAAPRVWVDDIVLPLGLTETAVLLWLAERARRGEPAVDWTTPQAADEFLRVAQRLINPMSGDYDRIKDALDWRRQAAIKLGEYFQPHKSRINRALEETLGKTAARRYQIPPRGANALLLAPEQIEIKD